MHWKSILIFLLFAAGPEMQAREVRVLKVLPHFLDSQARQSLSPSLYERDAYQAFLRQHPAERSALRFDVQWRGGSRKNGPLTLRVELRGVRGNAVVEERLEIPVGGGGWISRWNSAVLDGERFATFGEMVAWRVTLRDGATELAEQKSFLW